MSNKVYLAGPIKGLNWVKADEWRQYMISKLKEFDIEGVTPLRGKNQYVKPDEIILADYPHTICGNQKAIISRDRFDVMRSDLVFINFLNTTSISIGTVMEVAWADAFRKPIVLAMEKDNNIHNHPMIREASNFIVGDLDTGINVIKNVLVCS